jgi:hypothetical protein
MEKRSVTILIHLAVPTARSEVRHLVRELAARAGIVQVSPAARVARLLSIRYDPNVIALRTLFAQVRRTWTGARLVWSSANGGRERLEQLGPQAPSTAAISHCI